MTDPTPDAPSVAPRGLEVAGDAPSQQQPDDLVTALANELRTAERLGLIQPDSIARHLLGSGLVLPAADVIPKQAVLDLADQWERSGGPWWTHEQTRETHLAEVRALVAGGESRQEARRQAHARHVTEEKAP